MSKLFVITFKRPSTNFEKAIYGMEFSHCYDCEAFETEDLATSKLDEYKADSNYSDFDMFECEDFRYVEFCKMQDAFTNFAKTGEHSMKDDELEEDVDVGTESHTETIHLKLEMTRQLDDVSFDYHVDIDDVGQIVFTPDNNAVSFTDVNRLAGYDTTDDIVEGNTRTFAITLTANMISEDNNFDWFYDIDDVGQAVLTPDYENTSFLTVSVADSLNLVTECNESLHVTEAIDPNSEEFETKRDLCERVLDDLEEALNNAIEKTEKVEDMFRDIGIHWQDIDGYMTKYLQKFIEDDRGEVSVAEFRSRLEEYASGKGVEESLNEVFSSDKLVLESLSEEEKSSVIDRFMKGEIFISQADVAPTGESIVRLSELDDNKAEFYYCTESDIVICHNISAEE